jgi:hypothetical protein
VDTVRKSLSCIFNERYKKYISNSDEKIYFKAALLRKRRNWEVKLTETGCEDGMDQKGLKRRVLTPSVL